MKRQTFQIILNIFRALVVCVVIAVLVDRYHYSWTGFLFNKAGLCEYKSVTIPVKNGFPQKTGFDFDPHYIAKEMLKNPNYEVNSYYKNRGVIVSRKFGNISYQISFQNSRGSYEGFNLNTSSDIEEYSFPSVSGENCATLNHILKENVFIMIDDLPLSDSQKDEMKKYVTVAYVFRGNFW